MQLDHKSIVHEIQLNGDVVFAFPKPVPRRTMWISIRKKSLEYLYRM